MEKSHEEVNVTSSITLHCPLEQQSGEVSFVWTKNFVPITYNAQFYSHSNGSLYIHNTKVIIFQVNNKSKTIKLRSKTSLL